MTRGNMPYAKSSILHVYVFSLFEEEEGGIEGGEERKIEKSSGGKRSGCLIEIENGALSICTLLPSLSLSLSPSFRASVIVRRVEFVLRLRSGS